MRLCLANHEFFPDFTAGTEVITLGVARALRAGGHDVRIVTAIPDKRPLADSQRFDQYTFDGFPIDRFRHDYVPMAGQSNVMELEYNNLLFRGFFTDYLHRHRIDLVHFFHLGRITASAIDACHAQRVPAFFTATDFWCICPTIQLQWPEPDQNGNAANYYNSKSNVNKNGEALGLLPVFCRSSSPVSPCPGPNATGTNCLRHMVQRTQSPATQRWIELLPDWLLASAIAAARDGLFPSVALAQYAKALADRPSFLAARINSLSRIIVPSQTMQQLLTANGIDPTKITHLPYGIDISRIPRRPDKGTSPYLRVAFMGTLCHHKGAHVLAAAVRSLPANLPIRLSLFGRHDEFPAYVQQLKQIIANDPRISLPGPFPHEQVGQVLADVDVLAVPSLWYENTPMVIYEASAAGCAVVASDLPGMAELVRPEINGLLFCAGDAAQLANVLKRLVAERSLSRAWAQPRDRL